MSNIQRIREAKTLKPIIAFIGAAITFCIFCAM